MTFVDLLSEWLELATSVGSGRWEVVLLYEGVKWGVDPEDEEIRTLWFKSEVVQADRPVRVAFRIGKVESLPSALRDGLGWLEVEEVSVDPVLKDEFL